MEQDDEKKTFFGGVMMGVGFTVFIIIVAFLIIAVAPSMEREPVLQTSAHQELENVVVLENTGDYVPELVTLILEYDGYITTLDLYHPGDKAYLYLQDDPQKRQATIEAIDESGNRVTVFNHTFWMDTSGQVWMTPEIKTMRIKVCEDPVIGRLSMSTCIKPYT